MALLRQWACSAPGTELAPPVAPPVAPPPLSPPYSPPPALPPSGVDTARVLKISLMIAIYLLRTTLMNCLYPLEEAYRVPRRPTRHLHSR